MATIAAPTRHRAGKAARRRAATTALGIFFLAVLLFPVYWMFNAALQSGSNLFDLGLFPKNPSLDGFRKAWEDQSSNLKNSTIIAIGTTVLCILAATPAAWGLTRRRSRGTSAFLFGVLITQMIPGIVIANGLYAGFVRFDLLNTRHGLILANATASVPLAILVIRAFMLGIPRELVEAARIDGAGQLRTFFEIIVPMSRNAIITSGLFAFLLGWNDFLFAVTLTSTSEMRPVTLGIYNYIGARVQDWGMVMSAAVLASIPALVMLVVAQRFVSTGSATSGLK